MYYSEAFPRFAAELKILEQQDEALAKSFRSRYETWLAVHALILHQQTEAHPIQGLDEKLEAEVLRQERCRQAMLATMMASQEVKSGSLPDDEED